MTPKAFPPSVLSVVKAVPSRLPRTRLRGRLALLVLASVLPLIGFGLADVWADYRAERARALVQEVELARDLAAAVGAEIELRIAALEVLALSRSLRAGDLATFRAQAEAVLARQMPGANILLVREDGQQVMNLALPEGAPLPVRRNLENLRRVFATGQPSVSDVYPGLVLGRPVVAIEVPVRDAEGCIAYVLALNPTLDAFAEAIGRRGVGAGWRVAVLDRAGVRVARRTEADRAVGQPATPGMRAQIAARREGTAELEGLDGVRILAAWSPVEPHGRTVAVGIPVAELTAPAWRAVRWTLALGLALLVFGLIAAQIVARGVTRPIAALGRLAARPDAELADGPQATGLPEADKVAAALLGAARDRRAATAALEESERRLRLVVAELNHRAKNALATVQSLALQTARGEAASEPARFAREFTARLAALARAHDVLTALSWEAAALEAVLRAGLAPWLGEGGGTPAAAPPRIALACGCLDGGLPRASPGQAQALVLALFELATNAAKHGALSRPEGRVAVACRTEDEGRTVVIEWEERGGPPLAGPPARRGFGTRLLERALTHDLGPGGGVSLAFDPAGLRATIRVPARRAEPRAAAA
jgi:two-component sensor histidine kinase